MRTTFHAPTGTVLGLAALALVLVTNCTRLGSPGETERPATVPSLTRGSGAAAEPLELTEQRVSADIRDQMHRVVVELAFRAPPGQTATDGVFRFPLPALASVSSLAVSTSGGAAVYADVVERRRAGGILRALAEGSRASAHLNTGADGVFEVHLGCIPPQRAPRLELSYTEFLPMESGRYACCLPRAPAGVREALRVTVHSATPLNSVTCSLPTAQIRRGRNSALIDYHGNGGAGILRVGLRPDVAAAPLLARGYEQGSDGYFLLLANVPPGADADPEAPSGPFTSLRLETHGMPVAALYPQVLPDLPPGGHLVVSGRYQPPAREASVSFALHGLRSGRPVRFEAPLRRDSAEGGLSFIPRLWAQQYLKALFRQPQTEGRVADIVALSEEYAVLTPYTTFLVLDGPADLTDFGNVSDRERFGVHRRLRPSDGAWFFAEGRERARLETLRQQQRVADGAWAEFRLEALRPLFLFRDDAVFLTGALSRRRGLGDLEAWGRNRLEKPLTGQRQISRLGAPHSLRGELRLLAAVTAWEEMDRALAQAAALPLPPSSPPRQEALPRPPPQRIDKLGAGNAVNWQEPPPPAGEVLGLPRGESWLLGSRRLTEPMARILQPPRTPERRFPPEVRAAARGLLCQPRLTGPVLIETIEEMWGGRDGAKHWEQRCRLLVAPDRWLLVQDTRSTQTSSFPPQQSRRGCPTRRSSGRGWR